MSHLHHKVSALIDGELSPGARARALAHARSCPQCRREIVETFDVKRRLTRLAPIDVDTDLLDVVASIVPAALPIASGGRRSSLRRVFVGVGSMSAIVIALAYVVGAPDASQAKTVRPPVEEFAAEFADSTGEAPLSDPPVDGLAGDATPGTALPVGFGSTRHARAWKPSPRGPADLPAPRTATAGGDLGDQGGAVALLRHAVRASRHVGFMGARVVRSFTSSGVDSFQVDVQHVPGQGTAFDVLSTSGALRSESFVADSATADELAGGAVDQLAAAYDLAIDGSRAVDGRRTTVISASRDGVVSARFWVDDATGLLLRRTMYVDGRLVRWSGYTSIRVMRHGFMQHLPPELQEPPNTALATSIAPALGDKGWTCPQRLATGFRLQELYRLDTGGGVMHAEYTDGLSSVSVFEQRGSLDRWSLAGFRVQKVRGNELYIRAGLPTTVVWQSGETVFTVVTDVPQQMLGGLVAELPNGAVQPAAEGLATRIGQGLSRMASAVSP
ncbi:MAG: hypothetical protein QOI06_3404 [Nocardioidaceae bacterium]|nr:hypothetical protein [Nocardioidaceae bacterium]